MGKEEFKEHIVKGNTFKKDFIILGGAMLEGECIPDTLVKVPLKTINRHGLIAGATGTGKTKSLQVISEQLSLKGVPVFLMDIKGDLSGLAAPGEHNDHIEWRHGSIGIPYKAEKFPVELLSISEEKGVRMRATVSEFGPVLFAKMLELNETQKSIITVIFKYCDDQKLPLLDLKDLKKVIQYSLKEGKSEIEEEYGRISSASANTIVRKIMELEQQGADQFFGEKSFEVKHLLRKENGKGIINIMRLTDIQDRPKLFSTFMLSLLAEIYHSFPEQGDSDKPKLAIFIDEAHLIFKNASTALLDQIEIIVKLIRSKGVGIFFITQNPTDVPDAVLSQLGLKVQHALRAFTAKDRKAIKQTAENYPISKYYKTDEVLTSLGIGEALVSALNEKGRPTPLAATLMRAPKSRMDILTNEEINDLVMSSSLVEIYNEEIDRESAYEKLTKKIKKASSPKHRSKMEAENKKAAKTSSKKEGTMMESLSKNTMVRQLGRTVIREITRGLLGALGVR